MTTTGSPVTYVLSFGGLQLLANYGAHVNATRSRSSTPSGRPRVARAGRRPWTLGLAAVVFGAVLVAPALIAPETTSVAQSTTEQVRGARPAPATTGHRSTATPPQLAAGSPSPSGSSATAHAAGPAAVQAPATVGATGSSDPSTSGASSTPLAPAPISTTVHPAPTAGGSDPTGSPLAGATFYGPNAGAGQAAGLPGTSPQDGALLRELAQVPTATWLGSWSGDVAATVRHVVTAARAAGDVPVFVTYNIPGRDCGGFSAGGTDSAAAYQRWVQAIAAGVGTAEVVVVVEPDALAQLCGDQSARLSMLRSAVDVLERNPGTHTYLDAGHSNWVPAATMAERLRTAGVASSDGFALNVSNFQTTASNVAYGQQVSLLLGGVHFVVDTSRNGNGPGSDWCNPPGRAVGERPTGSTGQLRVDAYLWVKTPGESDGTCNGGPAAGTFWPSYAVALVRAGS